MTFSFSYSIKPVNLLVLSLLGIYRSVMGVVNIVFTASMLLLAIRFWQEAILPVRILLCTGVLFFPVFQPVLIYIRSRNIVAAMPDGMRMDFDNTGITISTKDQISPVAYSDLKSPLRIAGMLVLYRKTGQGFILNKQVLGNKETELFTFLKKRLG